jgi:cytochrome c oxidase subunit 4
MARTKLYTAIFVVLMVFSTTQAFVEQTELIDNAYWTAFGIIIGLSTIKAIIVAGYYQHLRWEPPAVTYIVLGGLFAALALTTAAAYSIL